MKAVIVLKNDTFKRITLVITTNSCYLFFCVDFQGSNAGRGFLPEY